MASADITTFAAHQSPDNYAQFWKNNWAVLKEFGLADAELTLDLLKCMLPRRAKVTEACGLLSHGLAYVKEATDAAIRDLNVATSNEKLAKDLRGELAGTDDATEQAAEKSTQINRI
eukprot:8360769-Pyramimonas_sp.AAC.1